MDWQQAAALALVAAAVIWAMLSAARRRRRGGGCSGCAAALAHPRPDAIARDSAPIRRETYAVDPKTEEVRSRRLRG